MTHENKTESKVSSHIAGDLNIKIQTGLNVQRGTTKPCKERSTKNPQHKNQRLERPVVMIKTI